MEPVFAMYCALVDERNSLLTFKVGNSISKQGVASVVSWTQIELKEAVAN